MSQKVSTPNLAQAAPTNLISSIPPSLRGRSSRPYPEPPLSDVQIKVRDHVLYLTLLQKFGTAIWYGISGHPTLDRHELSEHQLRLNQIQFKLRRAKGMFEDAAGSNPDGATGAMITAQRTIKAVKRCFRTIENGLNVQETEGMTEGGLDLAIRKLRRVEARNAVLRGIADYEGLRTIDRTVGVRGGMSALRECTAGYGSMARENILPSSMTTEVEHSPCAICCGPLTEDPDEDDADEQKHPCTASADDSDNDDTTCQNDWPRNVFPFESSEEEDDDEEDECEEERKEDAVPVFKTPCCKQHLHVSCSATYLNGRNKICPLCRGEWATAVAVRILDVRTAQVSKMMIINIKTGRY